MKKIRLLGTVVIVLMFSLMALGSMDKKEEKKQDTKEIVKTDSSGNDTSKTDNENKDDTTNIGNEKEKNNLTVKIEETVVYDENNIKNNYGPKFCKSIHEFSYIVSKGNVIEESNSRQVLLGNKSTTNMTINNKISDLKNTIDEKEIKKKKTKSVNKRSIFKDKTESLNDKKDNINNNEESDEDSGDSFGLENNSDC